MKLMTEAETLAQIRAWYERHQFDYDPRSSNPPKVWTEYFRWLLDHVRVDESV